MARAMKVRFAKFHGLGNDFLVVGGRGSKGQAGLPAPLGPFARAITERHTGIGADGLVVILAPRKRQNDARARFFNADGSEAEMSGNGIRCAAAFLVSEAGSLRPTGSKRLLRIETGVGVKTLGRIEHAGRGWVFEVGMGAPILDPAKIPFKAEGSPIPIVGFPLRTERGLLPVTVTSMGNPHCTVFVADFESIDWQRLGREIERNPLFPRRTNVEFVKVISKSEVQARFWERGVGQTLSSGTGSCGAAVACILNGLTRRKVRVRTLAGNLEVHWPEAGEVTLTGPVEKVAEGTYTG
jgi:diaminopimelate epimerase